VFACEATGLAGELARLHRDALDAGMALGMVEPVDSRALEASYRELIFGLDARERIVVVAETSEGIVGMAHLAISQAGNARHRAEVQRVAVAGTSRGAGVGRRLMAAVEEAARGEGLTLLWLTTHDETEACAFYERIGYTKLGVMPDYSRRPDGTLCPGAFFFRLVT
jgi:GNAT superfamily N-acetyltransferase